MKKLAILISMCATVFAACNNSKTDTRSFIPGTYVNHAEGEYSVAYDTLIIQPMSEESGTYRIYRKTAFQRIENSKLMKVERENEQWTALYNDQTKSMQETKKGKIITFYPEANRLLVGNREYQKIK
jgi:hypothetical protein